MVMSHYIYCPKPQNLSAGGTVGYLTRLYMAFKEFRPQMMTDKDTKIVFKFAEAKTREHYLDTVTRDVFLEKNDCWRVLSEVLRCEGRVGSRGMKYSRLFRALPKCQIFNANDFANSIHINGAYSFFPVWNQLRQQGKAFSTLKILTTHNPFPPHEEEIGLRESRGKWSNAELSYFKNYLEVRDKLAFMLSDAILCPSEYSLEGYKDWSTWEDVIKAKPVYYCVTGAPIREVKSSRKDIRDALGVPEDATLIVFLGRKERVRGFDIFVEAAKCILAKSRKIWFVVLGDGALQSNISDDHFLEIGFTSQVSDYINAADACVTANRGSYFDLSMIEIMSLGAILIASNVGGNKWLRGKTRGVLYFNSGDVSELIAAIEYLLTVPVSERVQMREENKNLYSCELTPFHFQNNYQKVIDHIRNDIGERIFSSDIKEEMLKVQVIGKQREMLNSVIRSWKFAFNHILNG